MPASAVRLRILAVVLAIVACLALALAGYLFWLRSRAVSPTTALSLPTGLPVQADAPQTTLTPAEAAEAEAQIQKLMMELLSGGFRIEKISKDSPGYVIHGKTSDTVLECHLRPNPDRPKDGGKTGAKARGGLD